METQLTPCERVEALRGAWVDGYTPDDLYAQLPLLADWTGLDLVVVWDYCDRYGPGGDSRLYCRVAGPRLAEPPYVLAMFLSMPICGVNVSQLRTPHLQPLEPHGPPLDQIEACGVRQYCYEVRH